MIAANIGRTFLKAFNEKYNLDYSPKEFFEKEYFEVFFNHPKYMQWVTNSPFVQMKSGQKPHLLKDEERLEKLNNLHEKIEGGEKDASIAIGFPASEVKEFATTSGLVTDLETKIDSDDIYYSWIGGGLGVGVAGGYSIFFNEASVLLKLYEGWKVYRSYLNDDALDKIRGNQINTWNGQWLSFSLGKDFKKEADFSFFTKIGIFSESDKVIEVNTIKWSELFFSLSFAYPKNVFIAYVYALGQTNKTLGFFPFYFSSAIKLVECYKFLFGEQNVEKDYRKYEALMGIDIKRACELGTIGLQALEPKDIKKYFYSDKNLKLVKPKDEIKKGETDGDYAIRSAEIQQKDYENIISYRTYKTWLLAMITKNKAELSDYTVEVAETILQFVIGTKKTDRSNLVNKELLAAKSKKMFLDALVKVIKDVDEASLPALKSLRDHVHMMTAEDFGYFVTLLKFDYAYAERNL